ncbi:MAG: hypothetical protein RLZZ338_3384 [Cyanobacteriota bacterium]|jgi:hypothetical protein
MSITRFLATKITNYDNTKSIGARLRTKRIVPLINIMEQVYEEYGSVKIIDIGGTQTYWGIISSDVLDKYNVHITIANLPEMPIPKDQGRYSFIIADGCALSDLRDGSFHIAHSNSVIEHVGDWVRMVAFAKEVKRVASKYFVQTPNYWFPIEPHCMTPFFHWLPKPIRIWLVLHFQLGHLPKAETIDEAVRLVEGSRLLSKSMLRELFKEAEIVTERLLGLPKSFIAIKK